MSNSVIMEETYYKPEEVAKVMRVSTRAVYGWLREGKLQAYRPYGRWLITPEQLDCFVKGGPAAPGPAVAAQPVTERQLPTAGASPVAAQVNPLANGKNKRRR